MERIARYPWKERFARAEERGRFSRADRRAAFNWCRCAVGEKLGFPDIGAVNVTSMPEETERLGYAFYNAIRDNPRDISAARKIYNKIRNLPRAKLPALYY